MTLCEIFIMRFYCSSGVVQIYCFALVANGTVWAIFVDGFMRTFV